MVFRKLQMENNNQKMRVFSGVQPTGNIHLGNYLGAIKQFVKLQNNNCESIFCLVDLHALTSWQEPEILRSSTIELAATFMACGLNPNKSILFNQSKVTTHVQLSWILNCVGRIGWLNRMTQFKDKAGKNREKVSVGLFTYPILMAADILAYKATHVPVGEDQKQHLELARDIAMKFNTDFKEKDFFPLPEPIIQGDSTRVMSLRNGNLKMSKSDPSDYSRICLTDNADLIAKKIQKAKSDDKELPYSIEELSNRPEAKNLLEIYSSFNNQKIEKTISEFSGKPFSYFKPILSDIIINSLEPITKEIKKLLKEKKYIDNVLKSGAQKAERISKPIIEDIYKIVGLLI